MHYSCANLSYTAYFTYNFKLLSIRAGVEAVLFMSRT